MSYRKNNLIGIAILIIGIIAEILLLILRSQDFLLGVIIFTVGVIFLDIVHLNRIKAYEDKYGYLKDE